MNNIFYINYTYIYILKLLFDYITAKSQLFYMSTNKIHQIPNTPNKTIFILSWHFRRFIYYAPMNAAAAIAFGIVSYLLLLY